jgi:endonuclease YncB( thermonuclease family)
MSAPAITPTATTYAQLRVAVIAVVVRGRQKIDRAWVETYHETGRLINEHVLQFQERAGYGARVYEKLADDTGISVSTLRQCAQFQRCYPIQHARVELSWAHYRLLMQIADEARRTALETETVRQHWTSRDLETRVRRVNAATPGSNGDTPVPPIDLLVPRRGTPGLHPIVDRGGGPAVDLGFKIYRELGRASKLTTNDIVRLNEDGVRKVDNATKDELFTYAATVRKVVDGDTLVVAFPVAPGFTHELKLRLRGLDCPEMSTAAGRAAKAFVDGLIHAGDEVIISTTKPDKYDRYLADVFVDPKLRAESLELRDRSASQVSTLSPQPTAAPLLLNNALLEAGHAVRYDGGAKEE